MLKSLVVIAAVLLLLSGPGCGQNLGSRDSAVHAGEKHAANDVAEESRRHRYAAQMHLAQRAWNENEVALAVDILRKQQPRPEEKDVRGWEWHYLWRLCQDEKGIRQWA